MPLTEPVSFKARVQRYNRIQIPVKIRWAYRLEPGEVFRVDLRIAEQWLHPGDPHIPLLPATPQKSLYILLA